MKKVDKTQQRKKQPRQTPAKPKSVTELTDQDLEQVQGGQLQKYIDKTSPA